MVNLGLFGSIDGLSSLTFGGKIDHITQQKWMALASFVFSKMAFIFSRFASGSYQIVNRVILNHFTMESPYFSKRTTRSNITVKVKVEHDLSPPKESEQHAAEKKRLPRKRQINEKVEIKYEETEPVEEVQKKTSDWEPPLWREQLKNIYEMRKYRNAPVDTMGCDVISDTLASPEVK